MKIYVLCTLSIGVDILNGLIGKMPLVGVVGLTERMPGDAISGYIFMRPYCDQSNLEFIPVESYALADDKDKQRLLALEIDILLVLGWQRLVPDWLIQHCKIGVVGIHGSWAGISGGRGRSPQTWSLLLGKEQFAVSIFWIDPGIDDGAVIDTRVFPLTPFDDIRMVNHKVSLLTAQMLTENFHRTKLDRHLAVPQPAEAKYLPQRLPEDGAIDWHRSARQIYDFIRAQTHPYPGAYTFFAQAKLIIWRASMLELDLDLTAIRPGQIVQIFQCGDLLVNTQMGLLLIDDYAVEPVEAKAWLHSGIVFESDSYAKQMGTIVERHRSKYPNLDVVLEISNEANRSRED
jgi:UDP-4-amino-4-deoxy-L-arabinose formyltransferase/UDP-glucuronic acid dehydrogenase (UDP-4-keto-hexauronic acid decarboxylating)